MSHTSRLSLTLSVLSLLVAGALGAAPVNSDPLDAAPDRGAVASEPVERGGLVRSPASPVAPSPKTVDGQAGDWIGQPSRIGGTSRLDAGEHVYSDFLYDAFGADDGRDAERLAVLGPAMEFEDRLHRVDALFQAAGDQFGAPPPFGALDHYGDNDARAVADLSEVRWATSDGSLDLLARTTVLEDANALRLLLLADTDGEARESAAEVGFGSGLTTARHDVAVLVSAGGVVARDLGSGEASLLDAAVAADGSGWTNALEARLPRNLLAPEGTLRVTVIAGVADDEGSFVPANVAYRSDEPATIYNDREQAISLHDADADRFVAEIDLGLLEAGASENVRPGPGYHERVFTSGDNISRESPEDAILQRYGLFIPSGFAPDAPTPVTFWLHYRGGKAHSGAAWTPRLIHQLGEEHGNVVVTPHARGTSTWYVSKAHQDFFEVFEDVHASMTVDPQRRYLSGYSMGGYGTYLFGLLYPDLFAAGFPQSGAVTQGLWTGEGPDDCQTGTCFSGANDGDANAQLTYRILENGRHFPIAIDHGSDDELVPITGVQRMALRMRDLGYRYRMTTFPGYEHYSQAIIDEWADGAAYLSSHTLPANPRHVTYKVVPALVQALNTVRADGVAFSFDPDGAWWVDGIDVRDGDPSDPSVSGLVDAVSHALGSTGHETFPEAGVVSPVDHSTPYVRHGQVWLPGDPLETRNAFEVDLTNVARLVMDAGRMGLRYDTPAEGVVRTDGASEVVLSGIDRPVNVVVDGAAVPGAWRDGRVVLDLRTGEHEVRLVARAR